MKRYLVEPGASVDLAKRDPDDRSAFSGGKDEAREELEKLSKRLADLQELLYAEHERKVLIVLQGMDTSGKDGVIRHVFEGVNPQGVRVAAFKVPTPEERDHDYLWRVHSQVPGKGEIAIFNRSHYEDVLVVLVHDLISADEAKRRYRQIAEFERALVEEGTVILKFFLHLSREEQTKRLRARLDDPQKQWKFNVQDLKERALWREYGRAYEKALEHTSTEWAPWRIVPSDTKWFRNLVVARTLVDALEGLKMKWPEPDVDLSRVTVE